MKTNKITIKSKGTIIDQITKNVFKSAALLSASFVIVIAVIVLIRGVYPFITDNGGLGRVDLFHFLTGDIWLIGETFVSNIYAIGFIIVSTFPLGF